MDTKKVLQQLLKIADNQQKIIMKLAQGLPPDSLPNSGTTYGGGHEAPPVAPTPPASLKPTPIAHVPSKVYYDAMTPQQKASLAAGPEVHGSEMRIRFKPGQATQANYDSLLKLLQTLTSQNKVQQAYSLKAV